jgi:23S rRNA pseudouridine1911/1915/1917 synthase
LEHPQTGEILAWEVPLPDDIEGLLAALRKHVKELENHDV